jgi:hypothetical protein
MPRHVSFEQSGLTIEFRGLLRLATMHRRVHVPWEAVADVRAGATDAPRGLHGRFHRGRRLQFLSFDDPQEVVRLVIDRSVAGAPPFDDVIVGCGRPGRLAVEVRRRVQAIGGVRVAARAA